MGENHRNQRETYLWLVHAHYQIEGVACELVFSVRD
jgi:hypothetical protein